MLNIAEIDLPDDAEARDLLVLLESYATDPMGGDQALCAFRFPQPGGRAANCPPSWVLPRAWRSAATI